MANDADGKFAQLAALAGGQCLGRSYYDTLTGVDTQRVEVLHITYGDAVVVSVAHHLVFDFFPALEALLYKHLG